MTAKKTPAKTGRKAATQATKRATAKKSVRRQRVDPALTQQAHADAAADAAADELTDDIRRFITQRLAMYDTPSEVVQAVNDEYGVTISRQQAQHYDPTVGRTPAKQWAHLFTATRAAFLEEKAKMPAAERAVRIRRLERMALAAEKMRNYPLAVSIYEQIAKECGDVFTNRQKLENANPNGAPLMGVTVEIHNGDGAPAVEVLT